MQASGHGYVKCENLSPMQILDSEQDAPQHLRMDEPTKVGSDSSDGKEQTIDEDIIHDDAETNLLEQSQVNSLTIFTSNIRKIVGLCGS